MGNLEWATWYGPRVGTVHVHYKNWDRVPKWGVFWYTDVVVQNAIHD